VVRAPAACPRVRVAPGRAIRAAADTVAGVASGVAVAAVGRPRLGPEPWAWIAKA